MASQRISVAALSRRRAAAAGARWASPSPSSSLSSIAPFPRVSSAFTAAPASCILCQWRGFSASPRVRREPKPPASQPPPPPPAPAAPDAPTEVPESILAPATPQMPPSPLANAPRSYGKRVDEFTPTPLPRPIGMPEPPLPGENSGIDLRSIREKRDDFANYDKHLARRQELKATIAKPYFRDWSNLKFSKGKTFIAPPRLFRADVSLFFPNLVGQRLMSADKALASSELSDTTPMIGQQAATIVAMFSSLWAENQVRSFVSAEANPALSEVLDANQGSVGKAQLLQINVEENAMRAWLVRRFRGSMKKRLNERDWENYLLVRRGISDSIRENIGLLNSKVGYVYLVDRHCRIRWAGSGPSEPEERQSLVKGVQRLLAEAKNEVW